MNDALHDARQRLVSLREHRAADALGALHASFDEPMLRIVVFGEFNRGKSTLINALVGRMALPARIVPTTGHVTRLLAGERDEVRVCMPGGRVESCSLDKLDGFASLSRDGRAREDVEEVTVFLNAPLLRQGITLIDTPGVNDSEAQTARAKRAIAQADLVLLVLDARRLLTDYERDLTVDWLGRQLGKPVVPVVNFMNLVGDKAPVRQRLRDWAAAHPGGALGRAWFEVNARGALDHAQGEGPAPGDDFEALRAALSSCQGSERHALQQRSRCGQLLAEVRSLRAANAPLVDQLRRDAGRVAKERAATHQKIVDLGRRFDAEAAADRTRMLNHGAAKLSAQLETLVARELADQRKATLEERANGAFQNHLSTGINRLESDANAGLLGLAGPGVGRPTPMTVTERLMLAARLQVGEMAIIPPSGGVMGGGAAAGALVGTFIIPLPVLGTFVGGAVGAFLAAAIGSREPDYAAAYISQARQKWAEAANEILAVARAQHEARCAEMRRRLDGELEKISPASERTPDVIGRRAEQLWRRRGKPSGRDAEFWAEAENAIWLEAAEEGASLSMSLSEREHLAHALEKAEWLLAEARDRKLR